VNCVSRGTGRPIPSKPHACRVEGPTVSIDFNDMQDDANHIHMFHGEKLADVRFRVKLDIFGILLAAESSAIPVRWHTACSARRRLHVTVVGGTDANVVAPQRPRVMTSQ